MGPADSQGLQDCLLRLRARPHHGLPASSRPHPVSGVSEQSFHRSDAPLEAGKGEETRVLVVHCKKAPFDVYIGRPSEWGNPYEIGPDGTREEVIALFEASLTSLRKHQIKEELKGKILGCWCAPKPCHGDVLARIANE